MSIQKIFFTVFFLGLVAFSNQYTRLDLDNETTVTHPSVFHDEFLDTKSTIPTFEPDRINGSKVKPPKVLDLEGPNRTIFEGAYDNETTSSDSSDLSDASETSDSDAKNDIFDTISDKAKELEEKAFSKIERQRRIGKLQAQKYWQALRSKIMREANATNLSPEEIMLQLKSAKRGARKAWKDLKWKAKHGNDILEDLMDNMNDLNPNYTNKGSTITENNDTARPWNNSL
jgi:hypothetical protein